MMWNWNIDITRDCQEPLEAAERRQFKTLVLINIDWYRYRRKLSQFVSEFCVRTHTSFPSVGDHIVSYSEEYF